MRIIVADNSKNSLAVISAALKKLGHDVILATNSQQIFELFQAKRPDLLILDVEMDGLASAKQIRSINNNGKDWIPIIFLTESINDELIIKVSQIGGDDFLVRPINKVALVAKMQTMQRIVELRKKLFETTEQLSILSTTDALTGIYNRLQFDRVISEKIKHVNRHSCTFALLLIDLDNFKMVNDTFGHQVGNMILIEGAKRLKAHLREDDFLARIGGDEFAVILNEIENYDVVGDVAQKIINFLSLPYHLAGHDARTGASVGIALFPFLGGNQMKLQQNADLALAHAKELGGDNYQYYDEEFRMENDE